MIRATQVLETLANKGTISRPELTDAAMAERAECVMLNKGPFIQRAVRTLVDILERAHRYQHKKTARMTPLRWPETSPPQEDAVRFSPCRPHDAPAGRLDVPKREPTRRS